MSTILLLAEHDGQQPRQITLSAVTFVRELAAKTGGDFAILVMGAGTEGEKGRGGEGERGASSSVSPSPPLPFSPSVPEALQGYGATRVLVAEDTAAGLVADRAAQIVVEAVRAEGAAWIVAASSTFSKDLLPRAAALLDAGMLTDVIGIEGSGTDDLLFRRPMFAGNAIGTVRLAGPLRVLTVRPTAYSPAAAEGERGRRGEGETEPTLPFSPSPLLPFSPSAAALPDATEYVGLAETARASRRPELTEARVVVTGGRPMKDPETFERLVGGLADLLGGAAGATRAAVDGGIAENDLQVGQTGKIVAPDLYVALGVSGAIQHLAGMKDSKIVVAINKDTDAPIFDIADYGLVADVHQAVPELIEEIRRVRGG